MKRNKDSDILRAARKRIALYKRDHLCSAINDVRKGTVEQKTALLDWIEAMLQGALSYGAWLKANHPEMFTKMLHTKGSFRQGRLAWVDWMIAECEKEESRAQPA